MCGIIAYAGSERAAGILYEGLKKLEYRGYDSAGLSTLGGGRITTVKRAGRVENLAPLLKDAEGCCGIGHTRWATHGEAGSANAHPHEYGPFSIVHNGMIENYAELRAELVALGDAFFSQTDSEVIVHLLAREYSGDLAAALHAVTKRLKGCWAIAALCASFNGFAVARRGSPVLLGRGRRGNFAASDMSALVGFADSCCVLEEDDIALVTAEEIAVFDGAMRPVGRPFRPVEGKAGGEDGKGCAHYMLKEICQNARTMRATCAALASFSRSEELTARLRSADKIVLTGCGTAYNACLIGARLLEWEYGCPVRACIAGEARCDPPRVTRRTVCIAVSQSGETADTLRAALTLREGGAYLVSVTNVGYSAITRISDMVLPVCAGPEVCVAATKSYIGQLAVFHLISSPRTAASRRALLSSVADRVEELTAEGEYARTIARLCADSRAVFFVGRGADYDVAVEASLKLREVSYIFSAGMPASELKHGTLALVDPTVLSVVIISDGGTAEKCVNAVEQILSRRGKVAVVTTLPRIAESLGGRVDACWLLPCVPAHASAFVTATALQLVAYRAALLLGLDPDKPRNLAKSVTVE